MEPNAVLSGNQNIASHHQPELSIQSSYMHNSQTAPQQSAEGPEQSELNK